MSGITSGVGLFSGIDRNQIIGQLLRIEERPKTSIQRRIASLQGLSAAYLDVTSKISALRTSAQSFRGDRVFESAAASSSNADAVRATASVGAPSGEYRVNVGRLASTQQMMTRGFSSTSAGLGLSEVIVEGAEGRVDNSNRLSTLNGGAGVQRGSIQVTDGTGATATIDISRASTINDVIDAINNTTGVRVRARLDDTDTIGNNRNGLLITDISGGTGNLTIANVGGATTATDLGIAGSVARNNRLDNNSGTSGSIVGTQIRGRRINTIGTNTALSQLNDGLGVAFDQTVGVTTPDIRVTLRNGSTLDIDLGAVYNAQGAQVQGQANTLGDVVSRINAAGNGNLTASIGADGVSLQIVDSSASSGTTTIADFSAGSSNPAAPRTATDLGIAGTTTTGTINGSRLVGKLNSVSTSRILGGQSPLGDNQLRGTYRNGTNFSLTVDTSLSLSDMLASIGQQSGGRLTASIDQSGNRIVLTDTTGGTGRLVILGAGDAGGTQMAEQLGLATGSAGVASSTVTGQRLQRQYVSYATQTSQLNYGRGIGSGRFEIRAADGTRAEINIGSSVTTVAEVVNAINSAGSVTPEGGGSAVTKFRARINDSGDGIIVEDQSGGTGALAIRDVTGAVARSLFLAGTASTDNPLEINGSYERRLTVTPGDGLSTLAGAINNSGLNIRASTLTDGGANPFRLSISSRTSGVSGAFTFDAVGADLGLSTTNAARDSLVFFGSDNATTALAVETSSNSVSGAIPGVTLELRQTTSTPATISVSTDVEAITKKVQDFITAYNGLVDSIASRSNFDSTANRRGVLLGDSVTQELRGRLQQLVQSPAEGVQSSYRFLFEVGVRLGTGGKLSLDGEALKRAIERDPRGVIDLFAARVQSTGSSTRELAPGITVSESTSGAVTSRGVMEILADTLEAYTRSNTGVLTRQSSTIEDQIRAQNARITTIDQRIEARRRILETQFIRMESSIGRLQSQGGNVSNIRQVTSGFGAG